MQDIAPEKLEKRLFHQVGTAISDFSLIEDGDRILVAVSGGKDSWTLLHLLTELRKRAPVKFDLMAVNIHEGFEGFRQETIGNYLKERKTPFHLEQFDIANVIEEKSSPGNVPCALCARLRRGCLYGLAERFECNKIALGHHQDDLIETLLLNTFFTGRIASMAPKLKAEDGKNTVIRPLVYVTESDIVDYTRQMKFPVVGCECRQLKNKDLKFDFQRKMVKDLITDLEKRIPHIRHSLLGSLKNVRPSHLLDTKLWDFS